MAGRIDHAAEVAAVRGVAASLGLPGIVDVHTHFMPRNVLEKVWAYFDAAGPLVGRPWPIRYRHEEEERVARLRDFGVLAFTSMLYPHRPGMAEWLNAWAADFAARTPDCLHTATFYPEAGAADYVGTALSAGARVFKSHIQVGDYDPADPLLDPVWGQLAEAGVPTVIHCGSGPVAGRFTGPEPIRQVLARHPRLPLIIAHMGMPEYSDFLDLAAAHEHVHLDTTMSFTPFTDELMPMDPSTVARLADFGDRILFGSDFPNIPYSYTVAVDAVLGLGLGDDWNRAVLHDNAVRLFSLAPLGGRPAS
ncbi:amidohydrolase [Intrasporangium calvum]|uniref:Amidohydrolase n=1 Tax=Intrasporangium calvum TaxID=53358 RepID=A0ABT5GHZ9_9MICO|nr:amidohydrolase family protein [Intrasporangium calvum]MDC5697571.1 amidohydrolase [Intrasporangium calvum]